MRYTLGIIETYYIGMYNRGEKSELRDIISEIRGNKIIFEKYKLGIWVKSQNCEI